MHKQNIVKQLKGSTKVLWSRERDLEQARIARNYRVERTPNMAERRIIIKFAQQLLGHSPF